MQVGVGSCFGTFGELAQGEIKGKPFLFTFPCPLYSEAKFTPAQVGSLMGETKGRKLAFIAAERTLQWLGCPPSGYLSITSSIPVGKGMASSSADITAAIRAVATSFHTMLSPEQEAMIAASIEPTDGVMYEGITAVNQQTGELLQAFPDAPKFVCIGFDSGGTVNTRLFHGNKKSYNEAEKRTLDHIFHQMASGLQERNAERVLQAATKSAKVNERFLRKSNLHLFLQLAEVVNGGVIIGHSGTVIGLLLDANDSLLIKKQQEVIERVRIETGWKPLLVFEK
ncbi:hypothetical protein [Bacillus sp. REN10]|uniref:GHMP family kinase ATP-binding protein n=1 Tax=Bacillus sp. REN10 TaxID=2782541 RepID=UPI00193C2C68|nr:hypothetical protein [Bacillus sp. REN10]